MFSCFSFRDRGGEIFVIRFLPLFISITAPILLQSLSCLNDINVAHNQAFEKMSLSLVDIKYSLVTKQGKNKMVEGKNNNFKNI